MLEVLSPAGSNDALVAAVQNGADAVYLGCGGFNARMNAKNFTPEQLRQAEGSFCSSAFVRETTGVDNVCERSAVLGSGGTLYVKKHAGSGVTMAVALRPFHPDWRWQYE